jgi:hypothetical protein
MKYLKMLGLVAVAATALMAFLGAGTASATVFCSTNASPCPAGQKWPTGTEPRFTVRLGGAGIWTDTSGNVVAKCPEGEIRGTITSSGSATETVKTSVPASGFTWPGVEGCLKTITLEGGTLEYHAIEGTNNATVTVTGFKITIFIEAFSTSCIYGFGTGEDLGTLTGNGSSSAVLDINTVFLKKEGGVFCPSSLKWTEEFIQEKPSGTALYVKPS